jgi:hypothetical protein
MAIFSDYNAFAYFEGMKQRMPNMKKSSRAGKVLSLRSMALSQFRSEIDILTSPSTSGNPAAKEAVK